MLWAVMEMRNFISRGSAAPLALLFTVVSMFFTTAYLKNSFSQTAMEKFRYTEWKALYAAEAGLNDVGIVVLPYITSDTLLLPGGVMYGKDEKNQPIGMYKDIACSTQLIPNTTRKEYKAYSTGVAEYITTSGTPVSIQRRVFTSFLPQGFEEFMYFTHEEAPIGPGNTGTVNFGGADDLEGKVHTNGSMTFSQYGCPDFTGEVNVTFEAIEQNGNAINWGGCDEDVFEDSDGNTILDTVSQIIFPPENSAEVARQNATKTFVSDSKLFRPGKKDTLIMTEINFVEGGYWAAQWTYNIPPVGTPPAEYDFTWVDPASYAENSLALNELNSARFAIPGSFETEVGYDAIWLVLTGSDLNGTPVDPDLFEEGDNVSIVNASGSVVSGFEVANAIPFGDNVAISIGPGFFTSNPPNGPPPTFGFTAGEVVTVTNLDAPTGLAEDFEWNEQILYHDHDLTQTNPENWSGFCGAGDRQHFDFDYWTAGGTSCDIFTCPNEVYDSEHVYMSRTFFARGNSPQIIYIKGGQVLIRGVVDGQYSIVTDDYTEYRVHSSGSTIDRVWGNIWLIDDVVYSDSYGNGQIVHPQDGGTNNVLGLIAGGSVIIANTLPNGARGGGTSSGNIKINAAILAMNGGFISQYWQNTTAGHHGPLITNYDPRPIGDGRGGHRNNYRPDSQSGQYSSDNQGDYRGYVRLWGSVVQFRRGYMKRNTTGPYMTGDIGYDKDYHYDWNLKLNPPPYFPDLQNTNNTVVLKMASYGEANTYNDQE